MEGFVNLKCVWEPDAIISRGVQDESSPRYACRFAYSKINWFPGFSVPHAGAVAGNVMKLILVLELGDPPILRRDTV